ncbi:MAG: Lrp/AsnC family transcriptional regulator [Hyphomonadaceae bacterium]
MRGLDAIDWAILSALQHKGRITNRALGRRVGLCESACSERVARLREQGVIAGYRAVIDWNSLGAGFDAWAEITPDGQPGRVGGAVAAFLRASTCIVSSQRLAEANAYHRRAALCTPLLRRDEMRSSSI